ncbi:hypothetical protein COF80_12715 [Bacillus toyonensis]|uniref:hypothetical protein n=1 Tax=Bacillus toyonensis TaxID=155322 RepID=UPI000BFD00A2|nr:hypothetical protein [Bacillus toyonensis]PHE86318.1 hypothetical protein COF80_12715 [Bacillus toyonensis]
MPGNQTRKTAAGAIRGTAEIHVNLSISHTFISKQNYNHGFPYYFSTYYHTVGTKCFQLLIDG